MNVKQIFEYFQNRQEILLNSIREIVEIESPSFDEEGSSLVVEWTARQARRISPEVIAEKIEAKNYGAHLLIRAFSDDERSERSEKSEKSEKSKKPILLLGHTDTVHPSGTKTKNPTRIEGEKFYGCGIFDMKANIILMLEVLRFFAESDLKPARPVTIFLSCDEEIGSPTGRAIVEAEAVKSEFCLVCEPSANGKVKTGRKGTGMFTLQTHGIPAHAGLEPEKGASAILELSKLIPQIHALNNPEKATTANVCQITGGTASNVIPEYAECSIDLRFSSMEEAARIQKTIKKLQSSDARVSIKISGAINRPPLERTEKVVNLYEKARKLAATFDYELGETQVGGASDGNFVGALGVPVLDGLGVAGNGAHTLSEYILIDDLAKRATLLALLLLSE